MLAIIDAFTSVRDFFETGGWVLWVIFFTTVFMWTLIIERVWFFKGELPGTVQDIHKIWDNRDDQTSWHARRIREQLVSQVSIDSNRWLMIIKAFMAMLPLMGLMGTVWGMITVFEVMSYTGTGNARAMAGGVYKATLPTMAGLVAALSGLYPSNFLERKAAVEVEKVEDLLQHH
ncbi:MAG: MotA/TolQ/ExbB proton channel family protein [Gammaproteobacteria bacterium]